MVGVFSIYYSHLYHHIEGRVSGCPPGQCEMDWWRWVPPEGGVFKFSEGIPPIPSMSSIPFSIV